MSRGGSRRGHDRDNTPQVGPDGWAVASNSRPNTKAGDLSGFGKINKSSGTMTFGPSSIFSGKKADANKRDSASLSRASSNTNMFQMLQAGDGAAAEMPAPSRSRPSSRTASVDLGHGGTPPEPTGRPKLNLLPRSGLLPLDPLQV